MIRKKNGWLNAVKGMVKFEVIAMCKPGDEIIYFGETKKLYGLNGKIIAELTAGIWRVKLDGGFEILAKEQDLRAGSWQYSRGLFD